jgi:hypothetical protein
MSASTSSQADDRVPDDILVLSTDQAARFLGVSTVTLERWSGKKTGPAFVRLGLRRVGYRRADLEQYALMNRNREVGSDEAA